MNRERKASGVNSYEKDLFCHPLEWLIAHLSDNPTVRWLDICCGQGNALIECAEELARRCLNKRVLLRGIDLIDGFKPVPEKVDFLEWKVGSVLSSIADEKYDLITCAHGLHYIGDKLEVIKRSCSALTERGLFIANLDLQNIKVRGITGNQYIHRLLGNQGLNFDTYRKTLQCKGCRTITFALAYEGASDQAGPNYTGQEAVDSYYAQTDNTFMQS